MTERKNRNPDMPGREAEDMSGNDGTTTASFPYLASDDVVVVQRGPDPGGPGGAYRAFGETLRGLKTTFARIIEGPLTIQYPEEKTPVYPRFRGRHKLHRFEDTGLEKCVGCSLCAAACPADCIRVVAAENDPAERVSAGERVRLRPQRPDLHQGDAAGRADRAHAAADGGRVVEEVVFFVAAIGALGGAIAVVGLRNPFYSVLALVVHLISLAVLFLLLHSEFIAAAQVVVYAGAVMVLYVFVAAYVGGIEEPVWEPIPGQRLLAPLLGAALFVELSIAVLGSGLKALGTDGPHVADGFGAPSRIGTLMLERYLIPFEAASMLLLIAAVGAVVLAARRRSTAGEEGSNGVPVTPRELALGGGLGGAGVAPPDTQRAAPSGSGITSAAERRVASGGAPPTPPAPGSTGGPTA
jgi:NADH:ubiquinone oxidoreductase subunit 6 (subunit J)